MLFRAAVAAEGPRLWLKQRLRLRWRLRLRLSLSLRLRLRVRSTHHLMACEE